MRWGIVKHQDRFLALHVLILDFLDHLEKERSEFLLVRGPACHEDWFVQAASNGTEDSDKHHFAVDRHQHRLVLHVPSFRLADRLGSKTTFIRVDDGVVLQH